MAEHRQSLSSRVPATWLIQADEPLLPAVVAGTVRTVSGFSVYPSLSVSVPAGADLLHCCAPGLPWDRLQGLAGLLIDSSLSTLADDVPLAELSTRGTSLGFGVSPGAGRVRKVLDFYDRTGLTPQPLLITPPCGMVADYVPWRRIAEDLTERVS